MGPRLVLCAALLASAGACNKVTYVNPGTMPSGNLVVEKNFYFLWGLVGQADIWANKMCPSGLHQVQSKFSFLDVLIGAVTLGIVAPRTYEIECGRGA
jgi:hypothetical protein